MTLKNSSLTFSYYKLIFTLHGYGRKKKIKDCETNLIYL